MFSISQTLDHIEQLLVVISQAVNMEITVDQLVIKHTGEYQSLQKDYKDTTQLGDELITTLMKPILVEEGSEKSYQLADDGLAELVRGRLDVIHMKMAQLDQNWLAQTQQLQLGAGRQLSGSGESSY
ncbi:hypothetical protein LSH36_4g16125, partial [Paralvinella palmiformis]